MDTKVAIAIVTNRAVKPQTVFSLLNLKHDAIFPIIASEGYTTAEGRNYCVMQAIKNQCTHILFIDDDMVFPPETLDRLLSLDKPIVGVLSYSRKLPLQPTIAIGDADKPRVPTKEEIPNEPFKVFHVGMGVCLINLKFINTVGVVSYSDKMNLNPKIDQPWFNFTTQPTGQILHGEDHYFCKKAAEKRIEVWCDPTLQIGHVGDYNYV